MPVSRKRRKSHKSTAAAKAERRRLHTLQVRLTSSLAALAAAREEGLAERVAQARPHAAELAGRLLASPRSGTALEDEICALPGDGSAGPDDLAIALIEELRGRPEDTAEEVLRAVAAVMPAPIRARTAIEPADPEIAGEVRWTRDRYGSRFAITAPFSIPEGPVRWYLWDVDACDFDPRTEHAGFYASPEEALAAWQVATGGLVAGGTSWRRIDDSRLLNGLLPKPDDHDPETRFTEYHRCRRLAEVLLALPQVLVFDPVETALDAGPKAFGTWLRERPEFPEPEIFLIEELFDTWPSRVPELFDTCSPHRVELIAGEIGDDLRELLPAWVTWLAERTRLPAELRDRSLAGLSG